MCRLGTNAVTLYKQSSRAIVLDFITRNTVTLVKFHDLLTHAHTGRNYDVNSHVVRWF